MSLEATKWAWSSAAEHSARLVLLALADDHNGATGLCCPSVPRLMERTRLGKTSVLQGIAELERLGLVRVERKNGLGSRYLLAIGTGSDSGPVQIPDRSEKRTPPVQIPNRTRPDSEPVTGNNRKVTVPHTPKGGEDGPQPDLLKDPTAEAHHPKACVPGFDAFWRAYPRKVNKAAAERAWKRLKPRKELEARIENDVRKRASSPDWTKEAGQFIPHPASYLNGRRWEDEEPRAAIADLEAAIARHPANPESVHYRPEELTPAQREELAQLRTQLRTQLRAAR